MTKIIGNTTATPNPRPDWNQVDETKADFIKNKPFENSGINSSFTLKSFDEENYPSGEAYSKGAVVFGGRRYDKPSGQVSIVGKTILNTNGKFSISEDAAEHGANQAIVVGGGHLVGPDHTLYKKDTVRENTGGDFSASFGADIVNQSDKGIAAGNKLKLLQTETSEGQLKTPGACAIFGQLSEMHGPIAALSSGYGNITELGGNYSVLGGYKNYMFAQCAAGFGEQLYINGKAMLVGGIKNGTKDDPLTGEATIIVGGNIFNHGNYAALFGAKLINNANCALLAGYNHYNSSQARSSALFGENHYNNPEDEDAEGNYSLIAGVGHTNIARQSFILGSNCFNESSSSGNGLVNILLGSNLYRKTFVKKYGEVILGFANEPKNGLQLSVGNGAAISVNENTNDSDLIGNYYNDTDNYRRPTLITNSNLEVVKNLVATGKLTTIYKRSNAFEVYSDGRASVQSAPTKDNDVVRLKELKDVIGGAPEAYDTLKEIANWISKDTTITTTIINDISTLKNNNQNQDSEIANIKIDLIDVNEKINNTGIEIERWY